MKNQTVNNICQTDINYSPGRLKSKRKINSYSHRHSLKNKRIKYLNQKVHRHQTKKS